MSGHSGGDPIKVIRAALAANLAIAAVKFLAAYLSKSTATLAEAVHSLADTGNQALLFVGVRLATKREDEKFAFGRASERYFWPFVVALLLFSVGGVFALLEGARHLVSPEPPDLSDFWSLRRGPLLSLLVLGVSMVLEGYSCTVALREFRRSVGNMPIRKAMFAVKDPTIPLVLMEDIAALIGLSLAFVAVGLAALTGSGIFDALGSILVGLVLTVVATLIARDTHSLLLGERATPEMERAVVEEAEAKGDARVTQLLTMHMGPDFIVLALKVALDPEMRVADVERLIDEMEVRIRARVPEMKKVFIEPDSKGDGRGLPSAQEGAPERASLEAANGA